MEDFEALGLRVCTIPGVDPIEKRIEIRVVKNNDFVAWFQSTTRIRDGVRVTTINTQFVERHELTPQQVLAVRKWLREQMP